MNPATPVSKILTANDLESGSAAGWLLYGGQNEQ